MSTTLDTHNEVKTYYGETLSSTDDLLTAACCTGDETPDYVKAILATIEDEVMARFYGCGSPLPLGMEGLTVLDLGCGTGRDVFVASKLVGPEGFVIGVDMTDEQLEVARRNVAPQMKTFGFDKPNVDFRKGIIEDLSSAGIEDNSIDVVISNCVLNLAEDKEKAFAEIFRVLKPGGQLYFSDVFSDRRIPQDLINDPVLYGECLSGALYVEDFRRIMQKLGCADNREISRRVIELGSKEIEAKVGYITFYSITVRAFKLDTLEDICEDYGQVAYYNGTIPNAPHKFFLDDHHIFETGKPMLVCGNTASMVQDTAYGSHFKVIGDTATHFGSFDCSGDASSSDGLAAADCGC